MRVQLGLHSTWVACLGTSIWPQGWGEQEGANKFFGPLKKTRATLDTDFLSGLNRTIMGSNGDSLRASLGAPTSQEASQQEMGALDMKTMPICCPDSHIRASMAQYSI
jgi:hypothetical protein